MAAMEIEESSLGRLSRLFPRVDEKETPLPRSWSAKDKFSYIGLSQNNLRIHYKGSGKNHKDAAAVRASHSIPTGCGIYYFEIRVLSKGRDGYIGVGLSSSGVSLNKLPGWEKSSYGYHADDGCVFNSSGTGQQYGPTFTTGDTVGCGFNLVDRCIFFTKNGIRLGTAVPDVPASLTLYPTVGLQTPGEVVEANFGESPFVYDFEGMLTEMRHKVHQSIVTMPLPEGEGVWQSQLYRLVLSYLVHHGYTRTAEAFAQSTGLELGESVASIRNRQRIQSMVLKGRISRAVIAVEQLFPGMLEKEKELLFRLKCRQFVEIVAGCDKVKVESYHMTRDELAMDTNPPVDNEELEEEEERTDVVPVDFDNNLAAVEKLLSFGRELQQLYICLAEDSPTRELQVLLQDTYSLLAYPDPRVSPVGYLLNPAQREPVCASLNSAILKAQGLPSQPPLELALGQTNHCLRLMIQNGLGAAAFASIQELIKQSPR